MAAPSREGVAEVLAADGVSCGELSCVVLDPELMQVLRQWCRERGLENELLPHLMLLVINLGTAGLAVAGLLYGTGHERGLREALVRPTEEACLGRQACLSRGRQACRHCRHGFRPRGWWRFRWGPWSCVFGGSPQWCRPLSCRGGNSNGHP